MSYFRNMKYVPYQFGTSEEYTLHQNITAYVDIIDNVRNEASIYKKYRILPGDRPDNLSQKFYDHPKYYWTFFLMNDNLRNQGWPLDPYELLRLVQKERKDTVITSRNDLTGIFNIGSTVTGSSSGAVGTIVDRKLDLGQLVIEGTQNFLSGEEVTSLEDAVLNSITLAGVSPQYDSIWRYEEDGQPVDINPYEGPGATVSGVSYYDRYFRENENLRDIIVIKPNVIDTIYETHQETMANG